MRLTALIALAMAAVFATAAIAQPPAAAPTLSAPRARAGMGARQNLEQRLDQLAARIGMTEAEKAAAKEAIRAKVAAAASLSEQLRALSTVARKEKATDQELRDALAKYDAAVATYRQRVKEIDTRLKQSLSLRAQAALTVAGVLDNGLGPRAGNMQRSGATAGRRTRGQRPSAVPPAPNP
jgi:ABC-type transporter Mla subunit MlaD